MRRETDRKGEETIKGKRGQTDSTVLRGFKESKGVKRGKRQRRERVQTYRDSTDFNITTAGVESRNPVGGTEDSLCRGFSKKTINVCRNISLQLNEARCFPGDHGLPEEAHLLLS